MKSKRLVEIPLKQKQFIDGLLCLAVENSHYEDGCHECAFERGSVTCQFLACCICERTDGKSCHFERVFNK